MSEMMRQPKVLEKAQAEIRQAFRGKKKNPWERYSESELLKVSNQRNSKVTVTPSSSFDTPKRMQRVMWDWWIWDTPQNQKLLLMHGQLE